jgi:UDP-N-acetylmuramoylalanine--D-glutamate ligase
VARAAAAAGRPPPPLVSGGETMAAMVGTARKFAKPGDVVLLSPAAASFDRFKNATDRGDQFRAAVTALRPAPLRGERTLRGSARAPG